MTAFADAERAATGLAVRQTRLGAAAVAVLGAGMSLLVAATYESTVGSGGGVEALAALTGNPAIRTLFGEPVALENAGGFTVWRTGTAVAVLFGVWSLLAVTRTTRGEEDAGRWDLLLAGRVPAARVLAGRLTVVAGFVTVAGLAVAAALIGGGTRPSGALLHGAGLAVLGVFCVGVAGLTAQIFPSRAGATGAAVAVLGLGLLLRMVGDGAPELSWLRWLSPFGLLELARPYEANRWSPLVVLAGAALAGLGAAVLLVRGRDVRDGWLAAHAGRRPRVALLGGPYGFAVRRTLRPLAGWALGIGAYFLLIGLIAESMTGFLADNPQFADLAAQAGFAGLGSTEGYAATLFALLPMPIGGYVSVRVAALAADETERRLTLLYAGPVTRRRLLAAEVLATGGGALTLVVTAAVVTWAGMAMAGGGLGLPAALAGTTNVLTVVALCLGASVLALGLLPRAVVFAGAVPSIGGFLLLTTATSAGAPAWVGRLSPFDHLAPVPAEAPNWGAALAMLAVAAAAAVAGVVAYERRDLRG